MLPRKVGPLVRLRLTKLVVEKAETKSQRYTIWDTELRGFGVKVQPSGRKSYFAYYRTQSGQRDLSFTDFLNEEIGRVTYHNLRIARFVGNLVRCRYSFNEQL